MRARILLAATALFAAACSSATVETERADVASGPEPTVVGPKPTDAEPSMTSTTSTSSSTTNAEPATSEPPAESSSDPTVPDGDDAADEDDDASADSEDAIDELREPDLGVGDRLFPALGSSDVDVQSYAVRLTVDPTRETISASVTIEAAVAGDVRVLPLDQVDLQVERVEVDGASTTYETTDTELLIDLPAETGSNVEILVDYSFDPAGAQSAVGLPSGWFENERTNDSYVLNEPDGARTWLPSNDHPSDKAAWTFELTVPTGVTAAANGELIDQTTGGAGDVWVWAEPDPMPTYLVQLIIGSYEIVTAEPIISTTGRSIPITHVVPAGERSVFEPAFDSVGPQIEFFEELFGPYPLEQYGLAFVNDLSGLAMETQGRSMFGADDFASGELTFLAELLLAHELAHQWFGNAVSPAAWSDIWLNESLTTYAQWLWLDDAGLQPLERYADAMLAQRQTAGESTGEPSVPGMFGFLRYDGGATVVHALRLTIGDDAFFELMTSWIADNAGSSQTTDAFIELTEAVHGSDLTQFFDDWLFAGDLPDTYPV